MIIVIQCKDQVGLVAAISGVLAQQQLNIVSLREHVDRNANRFFIRIDLSDPAVASVASTETSSKNLADSWDIRAADLGTQLRALLPSDAIVTINPRAEKKIVLQVTKEYHCLSDILVRNHFKTLSATVQCVIGNHQMLEDICARFDIPFYFVSHEGISKPDFERSIRTIIDTYRPDYIVLAKFMRILSPEFIAAYRARIINIHHSFLPAFVGASPYKQAFDRGVKLIGATAHFVTDQLDEGPIIAQQIIPVNHTYTASDMVKAGKEIESAVLAHALRLVFEDRVLVYGNKTVVFE